MKRNGWAIVDQWDQVLIEASSFEQAFRFHLQLVHSWHEKRQMRIVAPSEPVGSEGQLMTRIS